MTIFNQVVHIFARKVPQLCQFHASIIGKTYVIAAVLISSLVSNWHQIIFAFSQSPIYLANQQSINNATNKNTKLN